MQGAQCEAISATGELASVRDSREVRTQTMVRVHKEVKDEVRELGDFEATGKTLADVPVVTATSAIKVVAISDDHGHAIGGQCIIEVRARSNATTQDDLAIAISGANDATWAISILPGQVAVIKASLGCRAVRGPGARV